MFESVISAVLAPDVLFLILGGVVMGIIFGAIPGLDAPVAITIMLPFSYSLDITHTIALLLGIYMGGISGGLIAAILLKIPGTAAAMATTFDGYPMTARGEGARALSIGTWSSFIGGTLSCFVLLFVTTAVADFAIGFGPMEYFGVAILALSLVVSLMDGRVIKGFISVCIGLLLATVGSSQLDGVAQRMTFGSVQMGAGFETVAIIMGMYAFVELYKAVNNIDLTFEVAKLGKKIFYFPALADITSQFWNYIRSTVIGAFVGIMPGMGPSVAGMVSYAQAKSSSKHPEKFGTGCVEGITASETANNACTGGALVPMLALAIPGDVSSSIILSAMTMQGITCGPLLVTQYIDVFRTFVLVALIANIFVLLVQSCTIRWTSKVVKIPRDLLVPIIVIFCITGAISINNRLFDAICILAFSIVGYILSKNDYPLQPLVLAFILGNMVETQYRRTIMYYGSMRAAFSEFSIGAVALILGVLFMVYGLTKEFPAARNVINRAKASVKKAFTSKKIQ